jgi:hypothetical protein
VSVAVDGGVIREYVLPCFRSSDHRFLPIHLRQQSTAKCIQTKFAGKYPGGEEEAAMRKPLESPELTTAEAEALDTLYRTTRDARLRTRAQMCRWRASSG